ncbi:MAG: AraC family transcriptional regulator [Alphaproteobacteria bacterium]|nr:MAG: AraC family transcriptional regulator [Alphaproteobacteria bacterium]
MTLFAATTEPLSATVLVVSGSSLMTVAATIDPMRACNRVTRRRLFEWRLVTIAGAPATLSCGLPLAGQGPLGGEAGGDLLVLVAGFDVLAHVDARTLTTLGRLYGRYRAVAGIESGSWIMARAGLLDGRAATTHWEDLEDFASAFPQVEVRADRFVIDGNLWSAGGASPAFDLMLHLIRGRYGHRTAMEVASVFIYDEAHAATDAQPLVSLGRLAVREPRVAHAIRIMEQSIDQPLTAAAIARRVGISVRRLETLFGRTLGETPAAYFAKLRLQSARRMVVDTALPMRDIAIRTGFSSLSAFSRAFRAHAGLSGSGLRRQSRLNRPE